MLAARLRPRGGTRLPVGGEARHTAVGRIDDQRSARAAVNSRRVHAAVPPELVVGTADVAFRILFTRVAVVPGDNPRFVLLRLGISEERFARELRRTLERR